MRTIRVTGKGQIMVKPDMTRITMTLEGLFKDYGETLRHSSEDTMAKSLCCLCITVFIRAVSRIRPI